MKHQITFVFVLLLCGCSNSSNEGFDQERLSQDIKENRSPIALSDYTEFHWDRMYVFPPYTPLKNVEAESGLMEVTVIDSFDSITLLVFKNEDSVVGHWEVGRDKADFSELYNKGGYSVLDAVFSIKHSDSWTYLVANQAGEAIGTRRAAPPTNTSL